MQPDRVKKYLRDIEDVIFELEQIVEEYTNFPTFKKDFMATKATERCLEIIGEAIKCILSEDPTIKISHTKRIIGLRNLIAHEYDKVSPSFYGSFYTRISPLLKTKYNP